MKPTCILAALLALVCLSTPFAFSQTAQTVLPVIGHVISLPTVLVDQNGNALGVAGNGLPTQPAQSALVTQTLTAGTPATIVIPAYTSAKFQIAGLNADSILVQQSLDGVNYVTATLLRSDLTTVTATALTGSTANAVYSVMVFGGCLKITRTGSADTGLTFTYRGTN